METVFSTTGWNLDKTIEALIDKTETKENRKKKKKLRKRNQEQ